MRNFVYKLLMCLTALIISVAAFAKADKKAAFKVRACHQFLFSEALTRLNPEKTVLQQVSQRLELLAKLDYNLVVFGVGNAYRSLLSLDANGKIKINGCTAAVLRQIVSRAIKLNIEPVFGMKFITKPNALVKGLAGKYPKLLVNPKSKYTIMDPTVTMSDGSKSYSATYLKIIDFIIKLYPKNHPPKYFQLEIDEFISDDMAKVAKKLGMTPPEAFAACLRKGSKYLLDKGITPVIWGDSLLSSTLGTARHGITIPGYKIDPRLKLKLGHSYYSTFKGKDYQLHQMVNFMTDRDKIIVADWHYRPSTTEEYPSVDYFQRVGFKDVWGATWNDMTNIRQFARYAEKRKCGGMMATMWNNYNPKSKLENKQILYNSSAYFHNPMLPLPKSTLRFKVVNKYGKILADENSTGVIPKNSGSLLFRAKLPAGSSPKAMDLFVFTGAQKKYLNFPLKFSRKKQELRGSFLIPKNISAPADFSLEYGFVNTKNNLYYLNKYISGFKYGKVGRTVSKAPTASLFYVDFSKVATKDLAKLWGGGKCSSPITIQKKNRVVPKIVDGGINCLSANGIWASTSTDNFMSKGFKIELEAKMTAKFSGNSFCALLTQGGFYNGFRLLIRKDQKLLFQFGGIGNNKPLWIFASKSFPMNKWTKVEISYRPPAGRSQGSLNVKLDGRQVANTRLSKAMISSKGALLGIGCEPKGIATRGKKQLMTRPNFPGLIRKLNICTL